MKHTTRQYYIYSLDKEIYETLKQNKGKRFWVELLTRICIIIDNKHKERDINMYTLCQEIHITNTIVTARPQP